MVEKYLELFLLNIDQKSECTKSPRLKKGYGC